MPTVSRQYELTAEVTFAIQDGVDLTHYIEPETGERVHRMDGIYPDIRTEEDILQHLAYNAIFNNVTDASRLDGWGDLPKGAITMRVSDQDIL